MFKNKLLLKLGMLLPALLVSTISFGQSETTEHKVERLQNLVSRLQQQVDRLYNLRAEPLDFVVNCNAGERISDLLAHIANSSNQATITVQGTCVESVVVTRDNVTIRGAGPLAEIQGEFPVLATEGVTGLAVESITLRGGFADFTCVRGSSAIATNVTMLGGVRGPLAFFGGSCYVVDSVIDGALQGATVGDNGSLRLQGTTIQNGTTGVLVFNNGSVTLDSSPLNPATIIRNNIVGVNAFSNGSLRPINAIIEGNAGTGINLNTGATMFGAAVSVIIQNNNTGIRIDNLAKAIVSPSYTITGNSFRGIDCYNTHVLTGTAPSIFANGFGGDYSPSCTPPPPPFIPPAP